MPSSKTAVTDEICRIESLVKRFPGHGDHSVAAVDDVSLVITRGSTLGLVGESGGGKSTVGRCIARLLRPSSGRVLFHGEDIWAISDKRFRPLRSHLQMVFQDPYDSLNPRMSVRETLEEPLVLRHVPKSERRERVTELLERVQLGGQHLRRYPHQLAGGQQQRVSIARALAANPEFVVLDEPTSSLDLTVRAEVIELLRAVQSNSDLAYLFISHDLSTLRYLADRIAVMYLGRIVEEGSTSTIFQQPTHPYTQNLLASTLVPDPTRPTVTLPTKQGTRQERRIVGGCAYRFQCPLAIQSCADIVPPLEEVAATGSKVACLRVDAARQMAAASTLSEHLRPIDSHTWVAKADAVPRVPDGDPGAAV
jgi:oligopeptide/dipeptide ABC transporter ATP-binding protein